MSHVENIHDINEKIILVKTLFTQLNDSAKDFPALARNSKRALASVKMLELNISDMISFELIDPPK